MLPDHARLRELFLAACDLPEPQQSVIGGRALRG